MTYRLADPNPAYVNLLGTNVAPGGSLKFYARGTTTEKATYSDPDMGGGTENENPVELDSAGRAETEIWLDGEYTVVLKDANDTTIWTRDVVPEIAPGLAIPSLLGNTGYFLSNDGSQPIWVPLLQLPDPTGSAGYMVVVNADGTGYQLQAQPEIEIPEPEVVITANSFRAGTSGSTTKYLRQWGTATAPASGTPQTSVSVTYPTAFASAAAPNIIPTTNSQPSGPVVWCLTAYSATGFTVSFDPAEGGSVSANIVNPVPFAWNVDGTVVVSS